MNNQFILDSRLANDCFEVINLKLSKVLLMNNNLFPWIILVPKKNSLKELIDLNAEEQNLLMEEISLISKAMMKLYSPDKLNVATLGNIVEQLHIHIISRRKNDSAWPQPVFGKETKPYTEANKQKVINDFLQYIK